MGVKVTNSSCLSTHWQGSCFKISFTICKGMQSQSTWQSLALIRASLQQVLGKDLHLWEEVLLLSWRPGSPLEATPDQGLASLPFLLVWSSLAWSSQTHHSHTESNSCACQRLWRSRWRCGRPAGCTSSCSQCAAASCCSCPPSVRRTGIREAQLFCTLSLLALPQVFHQTNLSTISNCLPHSLYLRLFLSPSFSLDFCQVTC